MIHPGIIRGSMNSLRCPLESPSRGFVWGFVRVYIGGSIWVFIRVSFWGAVCVWEGVGFGFGVRVGFGVRAGFGVKVRHGLDRRVRVLLELPPLDVGQRRDHALSTAEAGPAAVLRLPAVLDQLGQASGGRVAPVVAVWQLGTDALQG